MALQLINRQDAVSMEPYWLGLLQFHVSPATPERSERTPRVSFYTPSRRRLKVSSTSAHYAEQADTATETTEPSDDRVEGTPPQDRVLGLVNYLAGLAWESPGEPRITWGMALLALRAWSQTWEVVGKRLSVPNASPLPDGGILYTWNRDDHHFELEVFPDATAEFFYKNRATGELWGTDFTVGDPVPVEAHGKLALFT